MGSSHPCEVPSMIISMNRVILVNMRQYINENFTLLCNLPIILFRVSLWIYLFYNEIPPNVTLFIFDKFYLHLDQRRNLTFASLTLTFTFQLSYLICMPFYRLVLQNMPLWMLQFIPSHTFVFLKMKYLSLILTFCLNFSPNFQFWI